MKARHLYNKKKSEIFLKENLIDSPSRLSDDLSAVSRKRNSHNTYLNVSNS